MKIHIVQKGDTLWKIAKKYGVNFEELKKLNSQLSNPDMIMPGMKIKVPTTGGMVKKEAPIVGTTPGVAVQLGAKKEMPVLEHPYAKEKPKEMPIVEAPKKEMPIVKEAPIIKEAPIVKEAPKAPYTPKMPLPVIPEIDINNYYMMNMANMTVQQPQPVPQLPPKPINILPEVKEVPKVVAPVVESPIEIPQPVCEQPVYPENCVPVSPVMPGPGCIYPMGYPVQPFMPYQQMPSAAMPFTPTPGMVPPSPSIAPTVAGASYMPPQFDDESSSFMPQVPINIPGQGMGFENPVAGQQAMPPQFMQQPYMQQPYTQQPYMQQPYMQQPYMPEMQQMQSGNPSVPPSPDHPAMQNISPTGAYPSYPEMPVNYPAGTYQGYPEMQSGNPGFPGMQQGVQAGPFSPQMAGPGSFYPGMMPPYGNPSMVSPYGPMGYGYPQMGPQVMGTEYESPTNVMPQMGTQVYPAQGQWPVGTGGFGDCGCGAPAAAPQNFVPPTPAVQQNFVPPTPPIYSAPYTAPSNVAQPPYMNPYGMGSLGANPYMMPRYDDESNDY